MPDNAAAPGRGGSDPFGFDALELSWVREKRSAKWSRHPGQLAAWVADMDMPPAEPIIEAIRRTADSRDFGYPEWSGTDHGSPAVGVFVERSDRRYGWSIDPAEVREFCDVVQAVQATLMVATEPGDGVVLHMPSYPPLWQSLEAMNRRLIDVPARFASHPDAGGPIGSAEHSAGVSFDYDALERRLETEQASVLLLCHPHNPTGHRFDRAELERLAAIAERFDLLIISDEIHADLTYAPATHVPIASLSPAVAARTVSVHSSSKAFNIAGLRHAMAHIGSPMVRERLAALPDHLLGAFNVVAAATTVAAWTQCDDWLDALMVHFDRNRHLLTALLAEHLPDVVYRVPEATYLAWLDCSGCGFDEEPFEVFRRRGVQLNPGLDFGPLGSGHVRLNMATSGSILEQIVERMARPV